MANLDLRPLSLGEILDRSFAMYRQHFPLFVGIAAIPQIFVLAINLAQLFLEPARNPFALPAPGSTPPAIPSVFSALNATSITLGIAGFIFLFVAGLLVQGATVFAVADLYLGRSTTIRESLRRARGKVLVLFLVGLLTGLAFLGGFLLLIFPGFYVLCRLIAAVPVAIVEDQGPVAAVQRSFTLSRGMAGRAFLILLVSAMIIGSAGGLVGLPLGILIVIARNNVALIRFWTALMQVFQSAITALVTPILTIAVAVFYFDLRVRKEAFDLQMMLNPAAAPAAGGTAGVLS